MADAPSWLKGAFAAYLAALALAVLSPQPSWPSSDAGFDPFGPGWLADALRNVALFAPLGAALRLAGLRPWRIGLLGLALSCAIEVVQLAIPGRFPSPVDVVHNTLGTWLGGGLPFAAVLLREESRARPLRLGLVACGVSFALLVAVGVLAAPDTAADRYFGGWTLECCGLERYEGRVSGARVGHVAVPPYGPVARPEELREALAGRATIEVDGTLGPRPRGLAPLLQIVDDASNEVLLIGVEGDALVYHLRSRAERMGLHGPMATLPGALADGVAGDAFSIRVSRSAGSAWLSLDGGPRLRVDLALARGWALLWPARMLPRSSLPLFDVVWLALLVAPAGFWCARGGRVGWLGPIALVLCMAWLPSSSAVAPLSAWQWGWAACVLAAAALAGRGARASAIDGAQAERESASR